jgi:hypothetical protein
MFSTPITFLKFAAGAPPEPDPDAAAFLAATGITDPTIETAINDLVIDMKDAGIWTKMHVVYPFVGASSTTFKYNLMNPVDSDAAFRGTFNGPFSFTSSGLVGTGTNYVDTHFQLADLTTSPFFSVGSYVLDNVDPSAIGQMIPYTSEYPWDGPGDYPTYSCFINLGLETGLGLVDPGAEPYRSTWTPPANTYGLNAWSNISYTSHRVYLNDTLISNNTNNTTSANVTAVTFAVARRSGYDTKQTVAFSYIGDALTEAEYFDYVDIIQAFQTTLGREV